MKKTYIFPADVVRCLAILGVVGVHLIIPITARPDYFGGGVWWGTFLLNGIFRTSVPLFVMLSGYLTLGKTVTIKQNNQKIWRRLVVPLIGYYVIFSVANALMAWLRSEPFAYADILHNLSKNTHSSLYFLVILAFMQTLNPLWNLMTESKNLPIFKFVCAFFFGLGSVAYIFYYLSLREGEVFSTFSLWVMWLGYYLYGYLVRLQPSKLSSAETQRYWLLSIGGYVVTVFFGYLTLWLYHRQQNDLFYLGGQTYADSYLSISVIAMSIGVFNLLMRSPRIINLGKIISLKKVIQFLAGISFALYLNHLLVIDVLNKFFGITPDSPTMPNLIGYLVINTALTFSIAIPLAWILKHTPRINYLVGEK